MRRSFSAYEQDSVRSRMKDLTRRDCLKFGAFFGLAGLVTSYPIFIERYLVMTNLYRIPVTNLPDAFSGFRIVHLTDLHHGPLVPLAVIQHVVQHTNRLKRDLVVCTGDYILEKRASKQIDEVWPVLSRLEAPLGVYSVLGNHDHWADSEKSIEWLHRSGQDLRHKVKVIEKDGQRLWLAGAGDYWEDHKGLDEILAEVPVSDCRIVLAHNPDTADTEFSSRVDLMVSGHTHGGQVIIPFVGAPILPVQNKLYSSGLIKSPRGMSVFISRGIGWAIFPIRLNCPPEIAILELVPQPQKKET